MTAVHSNTNRRHSPPTEHVQVLKAYGVREGQALEDGSLNSIDWLRACERDKQCIYIHTGI